MAAVVYHGQAIANRQLSDEYVAKCHDFYLQCKRLNRTWVLPPHRRRVGVRAPAVRPGR